MSQENRCPQCGAELAADAPQGLCPACLLKRGLESQTTGVEADRPGAAAYAPPTPAELAPLFPDLEILELVGRGGMGVVYKARQKRLDRLVALKILSPSVAKDPAFADRFAREARAMALLSHPHIVAVYDFGQTSSPLPPGTSMGEGEANSPRPPGGGESESISPLPTGEGQGVRVVGSAGLYYFLMEYVDGLNLRRLLDSGKLAPKEALAIVPQICEALQYAHDKGVVHRDIKPENVLMDRSGQVKIADFGLAKLMGGKGDSPHLCEAPSGPFRQMGTVPFSAPLTGVGQVMGTPNYMAPEQIEHPQDVDHRADIYSLGVVFYQMLTGELPLGRFAPPSKKVQIDVRLDEVVLRALEKEPQRRYQQASEVKTEVENIAIAPAQVMPVVGQQNGTKVINWGGIAVRFFIALSAGIIYGVAADLRTGVVVGSVLLLALMAARILTALDMRRETRPQLGGDGRRQARAAGGWLWAPWQSPLVKEIVAHMTSREKRDALMRSAMFGVWNAATCFGPVFCIQWLPNPLNWIFAGLVLITGLSFYPLFRKIEREFLASTEWARQQGIKPDSLRRLANSRGGQLFERWSRTSRLNKAIVSLAVLLVILLIVRTFFAEAYVVPGDCAAPEVPRGSRVIAWKVGNTYVPHDLIVYHFEGQINLGRVVRNEGADLIVNRNGQPNFHVQRDAVIGKVICVYWRASATDSARTAGAAIPRSSDVVPLPPSPYPPHASDFTKEMTLTCEPSKPRFLVGEHVILHGTMVNTTSQSQPIGLNDLRGSHYLLSTGEKGSLDGPRLVPHVGAQMEEPGETFVAIGDLGPSWITRPGTHYMLFIGEKGSVVAPPLMPHAGAAHGSMTFSASVSAPIGVVTAEPIWHVLPGNSVYITLNCGIAEKPMKFSGRLNYIPMAIPVGSPPPAVPAEPLKSNEFTYEVVAAERPAKPAESQPEKAAQAERIQALQKVLEDVESQYRMGTIQPNELVAAQAAVLEAQLDAAATKAERIAILQKLLDNRRDAEKFARTYYENGRCTEDVLDKTMADTAAAEIRLAKEKSATGADNLSPAANREAQENIRKLEQERILSSAKTFLIRDVHYRIGTLDFDRWIAASDALLEAQLDAAETKAARIAILQKLLENRRDVENFAEEQFKRGTGSEADCLRTKTDRMVAWSRLEKEKAAAEPGNSPSKAGEPAKPRGPVLLYHVDSLPTGMTRAELTSKLLTAIDRKLNAGGKKLARVRTLDNGLFIEVAVLRPDDSDCRRVERLLSRPGMLEFRILANEEKDKSIIELAKKDPARIDVYDRPHRRYTKLAWWLPLQKDQVDGFNFKDIPLSKETWAEGETPIVLVLADPYNITDEYITKAEVVMDKNRPCIRFTLNDAGAKLFAKLTGEHLPDPSKHLRYRLGIILNGELVSAPKINEVISNRGEINGKFTEEQAAQIADALNAGALPTHLRLLP